MSRISLWLLCFFGLVSLARDSLCQGDLVRPITGYKRGYKDRVEYVVAEIHSTDLDKGTSPSARVRAYSKSMSGGYKGDDAGHLIASRLGGTGLHTYNIVPQNRVVNRGSWRTKVEAAVYNDVKNGNVDIFEVWPQYADSTATRPYKLTYRATHPDGSTVLKTDSMDNPLPPS